MPRREVQDIRAYWSGVGGGVLFVGALVLMMFLSDGSGGWEGVQVLGIRESVAPEVVVEALERKGLGPVVWEGSQEVELWEGRELGRYRLRDLPSRLDPADPRYDPYLSWLPSMFEGRVGGEVVSLLYVPQRHGALWFLFEVLPVLRAFPGKVVLMGQGWPVRFFLAGVFLGLLVWWAWGRWGVWAVAGGVGWVVVVGTGGVGMVPAAASGMVSFLLLLPPVAEVMERGVLWGWRWEEWGGVVWWGVIHLTVVVGWAVFIGSWAVVSALLVECGVVGMMIAYFTWWRSRLSHRVFRPVPLRRRTRTDSGRNLPRWGWGLLLLICATIAAGAGLAGDEVEIPLPGEGPWWQGADGYLAHRAFQEGFLFNVPFELPTQGTTVTLPRYRVVGNEVVREEVVVLVFDAAWFRRVEDLSPNRLEHLFLGTGRNVSFVPSQLTVQWRWPVQAAGLLILLLLLLPEILKRGAGLTFETRYGMRAAIRKEGRQVA
ncbi:hypothetical protein Spith_0459 [Spirochaeta thermophila DSM 6578]|uniref:Uncharacterized protein n=1 Tax=Winmispira thermophila (strain ATCC 700085 / DSM 6578 / Z-1203) TaxID=869211 RepID=G0GF42_WINT7|nr:hypothetical protein [Spirochaeta thermophila]AEJ60741.1 hypothetical protein Spith_0459 [Spirochaeta thermophila DSM 6578]